MGRLNEYANSCRELDIDHPCHPLTNIKHQQDRLITFARAYEEGEPIVSDAIYDGLIRMLQNTKAMFEEEWDEIDREEFRDGSWQFTGLFYMF